MACLNRKIVLFRLYLFSAQKEIFFFQNAEKLFLIKMDLSPSAALFADKYIFFENVYMCIYILNLLFIYAISITLYGSTMNLVR